MAEKENFKTTPGPYCQGFLAAPLEPYQHLGGEKDPLTTLPVFLFLRQVKFCEVFLVHVFWRVWRGRCSDSSGLEWDKDLGSMSWGILKVPFVGKGDDLDLKGCGRCSWKGQKLKLDGPYYLLLHEFAVPCQQLSTFLKRHFDFFSNLYSNSNFF